MMLFAECVSAKPLPDPRHLRDCTKSVSRQYENEGENEGKNEGENEGENDGENESENEGGDEGGRGCSQIKTKSLI